MSFQDRESLFEWDAQIDSMHRIAVAVLSMCR